MMNPEVKAQWVSDLRSGNFPQGRGVLHRQYSKEANRHTFCCLGVLCEAAVAAGVVERVESDNLGPSWEGIFRYEGPSGDHSSHHYLPYNVQVWADIFDADPYVTINGQRSKLSDHNDQGRSFAEIADAIEEQL